MTPAERIAELEEENARLRAELGRADDNVLLADVKRRLGSGSGVGAAAHIVVALYLANGAVVSNQRLFDVVPRAWRSLDWRNSKLLHVAICQARKTFGKGAIETVRAVGYRLTDAGLETIHAIDAPGQSEAA